MFDLIGGLLSLIFGTIVLFLGVIPFFVIYKRLGYSPWLALLWLIPPAGLIMTYIVAFSRREVDEEDVF